MRTLELRLEDLYSEPQNVNLGGRMGLALKFFDLALVSGMAALSDRDEFSPARVFSAAAGLTLLRFGVRIVGLESEPEEKGHA